MKVNETKEVGSVEQVGGKEPDRQAASVRPRADRVSIQEAHQVKEAVTAAKASTVPTRAARLRELESAIRSGDYKPDAGRLAEQLLQAAEVDARIRSMLRD
jgi:flagellar biosynthesis anti-sigma factor FlgM